MSVRGPTGKFFFDRIHDLYLYYLVLEHHVYDEVKDDFIYTKSGEIKIEGGWRGIAEKMTSVFGRQFKSDHVLRRYELICEKEDYINELFNDVTDFRDDLELVRAVMES
jgi:hypothetical protein